MGLGCSGSISGLSVRQGGEPESFLSRSWDARSFRDGGIRAQTRASRTALRVSDSASRRASAASAPGWYYCLPERRFRLPPHRSRHLGRSVLGRRLHAGPESQFLPAAGTGGQMDERRAFVPFLQRPSQQFGQQRGDMLAVHRVSPPFIRSRRMPRIRFMRDLTVPSATPVTRAASA